MSAAMTAVKSVGRVTSELAKGFTGQLMVPSNASGPAVVVLDPAQAAYEAHGRPKGPKKKKGQ